MRYALLDQFGEPAMWQAQDEHPAPVIASSIDGLITLVADWFDVLEHEALSEIARMGYKIVRQTIVNSPLSQDEVLQIVKKIQLVLS